MYCILLYFYLFVVLYKIYKKICMKTTDLANDNEDSVVSA